jgi:DNA-binding beta-propeller fold protein YncE
MPKLLRCPSCTGPLDLATAREERVTCSFCGNTLVLPEDDAPVRLPQAARRGLVGVAVGVLVASVAIIVLGSVVAVFVGRPDSSVTPPPTRPLARPAAGVPVTSALATTALEFGSKGIGPGEFEDNRAIAVDPQGRMYVAEYSNGRLQVFEPAGTFVTQWALDEDRVVLGVLADRAGHVLVAYPGIVAVHDATTGAVRHRIDGVWAEGMALTPDNRVLALNDDAIDEIDPATWTYRRVHEGLKARARAKRADLDKIAVDGLGNLYLLDRIGSEVLKFDREGAFLDRFGGRSDRLSSPHAIVVDGHGRVFVSTTSGIRVFDPAGRVVGELDVKQAFGMVVGSGNELYVAARPRVVKLAVKGQS